MSKATVTLLECVQIYNALNSLDGYKVKVRQNGEDVIDLVPYDWDGPVHYAIARNIRALKAHVEAHGDAQNRTLKANSTDKNGVTTVNKIEVAAQMRKVNNQLVEVNFHDWPGATPESVFKLDTHAVPSSIIAVLLPLFDGEFSAPLPELINVEESSD